MTKRCHIAFGQPHSLPRSCRPQTTERDDRRKRGENQRGAKRHVRIETKYHSGAHVGSEENGEQKKEKRHFPGQPQTRRRSPRWLADSAHDVGGEGKPRAQHEHASNRRIKRWPALAR